MQLSTSAELYRNVYPWNVPATGYDDAGINRPAGYTVYWRYVSEDGQWVAVSDPDPTPAISNMSWFFVRKTAFPRSVAAAQAPNTQHTVARRLGPRLQERSRGRLSQGTSRVRLATTRRRQPDRCSRQPQPSAAWIVRARYMHYRSSILAAVAVIGSALSIASVARAATSAPSGIVGHPVVFRYHSPGADSDIAQFGVMMTVARHGSPGRYSRTQIRSASLSVSGITEDFNLGLDGSPGTTRGTCFTARLAVPGTTRLGAKQAGDTVRVRLTVAGHRYTHDLKLRSGNLDGSTRAELATIKAAGCRPPLAK